MMYSASFVPYTLLFKKPAKTSRNELAEHQVYYLKLTRLIDGKVGYGEAAPLKGLSIDDVPHFEQQLQFVCDNLHLGWQNLYEDLIAFPSLQFALETAILSLQNEDSFLLFKSNFTDGNSAIPINGLIWMNDKETMLKEALEKASQGFNTIKFKVGALDFDDECRMLEAFRKQYNAFKITIRLDANGAFNGDDAAEKLRELARFDIHSIEQPIKPKQWDLMEMLCATSKIPIALDEELIGVSVSNHGKDVLQKIKPKYIILKPTLIGGLRNSDAWIKLAEQHDIGWWATSALESNVGLNAIAQWTATKNLQLPQGLGTGSLYLNNIPSPLSVNQGVLSYQRQETWDIGILNQTT